MQNTIKRGDIYLVNLNLPAKKDKEQQSEQMSEQRGYRPTLVISNDIGNDNGPTVILAAMTSNLEKPILPTHVAVQAKCGLQYDSIILLEQLKTLDKQKLRRYIGTLDEATMKEIDAALAVSVGIGV